MSSEIAIIKLESTQFKDLLTTIDYVRNQLKDISSRLGGIEGELADIRNEISYLRK